MMYTVMMPDMQQRDEFKGGNAKKTVRAGGALIDISLDAQGVWRIDRLYATDARMYLDAKYAPGARFIP